MTTQNLRSLRGTLFSSTTSLASKSMVDGFYLLLGLPEPLCSSAASVKGCATQRLQVAVAGKLDLSTHRQLVTLDRFPSQRLPTVRRLFMAISPYLLSYLILSTSNSVNVIFCVLSSPLAHMVVFANDRPSLFFQLSPKPKAIPEPCLVHTQSAMIFNSVQSFSHGHSRQK